MEPAPKPKLTMTKGAASLGENSLQMQMMLQVLDHLTLIDKRTRQIEEHNKQMEERSKQIEDQVAKIPAII
jgi:hypothetical protein